MGELGRPRRPFIARLLELLRARFPARFGSLDAEAVYRAANRVQPSLIRVEADEVTYNLHIVLRFELELELIEGRLAAADLPQAWAARMQEYFGLAVPDHAHGVLQDVHWAAGSFGYFPTYALGNVIAGQLWELRRPRPRSRPAARGGRSGGSAQADGRARIPARRQVRARRADRAGGGGPLDPALLGYLRAKFGELYGL